MFPPHEWARLDRVLMEKLFMYHELQQRYA